MEIQPLATPHGLLGLKCNDFAIVAADQINIQNVFLMGEDDQKLHEINDHTVIGMIGDNADTAQLLQYIKRNVQLYRLRNSFSMQVGTVAHFASRTLADASLLHKYNTNLLIAGFDGEGSHLYVLDELGTCIKTPFAALGLPGMLGWSILDQYYRPDMRETEAYEVMKKCVNVIGQRLILQLPKFQVVIISKHGALQLPQLQRSVDGS